MFGHFELSVEALVAQNLGDEDWEELVPHTNEGCKRTANFEKEKEHPPREYEPNIDKFTPDALHAVRNH